MAFQIKDDLFDYTEAIGKPTGIDIKEQMTVNPCFKYLYCKRKSWLINSIKTIIRTRGVLKK
jgi:geranylgeranyl pyrophosphate synthase